jgi:hypothetical protein
MKVYTSLTKNFFKHLSQGEEVQYYSYNIKAKDGKIIVRRKEKDGEVEFHYWIKKGDEFGFSKEQVKDIFSNIESPIFVMRLKK